MRHETLCLGIAGLLLGGCAAVEEDVEHVEVRMERARVSPFLMFQDGRAAEAMAFYVSLFADARVVSDLRFGPGEMNAEGMVKTGVIELNGQRVMFTDSPPVHQFGFTPSSSLFVDCTSAEEQEVLVSALGDGGQFMMPLGDYGFSKRFAFLQDKFGVSWQINLPFDE